MYNVTSPGGKIIACKVDLKKLGRKVPDGNLMGDAMVLLDPDSGSELKLLPDGELKDGEEAWVIEAKPTADFLGGAEANAEQLNMMLDAQMARTRIHIGKKTKVLRRVEYFAKTGDEMTGEMEFRNIKINEGVTDEDFDFTPTDDMQVTDITERVRKEMADADAKKRAAYEKSRKVEWSDAAMPAKGTRAPALTLKTLSGATFDLAAQKGKRVLIYFWASWKKESVAMLADVAKLAGPNLVVVAVSLDEPGNSDAIAKLLRTKSITVTCALADKETIATYKVSDVPSFVLIDEKGVVITSDANPTDAATIEKAVAGAAE